MGGTGLTLKGFKEFAEIFKPGKFEPRLKKEVAKATQKNALIAEGAIKRGINSGKGLKPNSPFTVALKGSSRSLVDSGELLKSITGRADAWDTAYVGVLKSKIRRDKQGNMEDVLQISKILHDGATVPVTQKMRNFFFYMANRYESGEIKEPWFPLSSRTKFIVIPARPFLKFAVMAGEMRKYNSNWADAVQRALSGVVLGK